MPRKLERSTAALEVIAADEIDVLVLPGRDVAEARDVRPHGPRVIVRRLGSDAARDEAAAANAHEVLAEMRAEQARRVAEAVGMCLRRRVQQDARRVERAGAKHDDASLEVEDLARVRVDDAD